MSKKDCSKKAEDLEKSNAIYGLFVASYYFLAAEEYTKMINSLKSYRGFIGRKSSKKQKIKSLLRSLQSVNLKYFHPLLFNKRDLPDSILLEKNLKRIKSIIEEYANRKGLYLFQNFQSTLAIYITESPRDFLKARDLLLK